MNEEYDKGPDGEDLPFIEDIVDDLLDLVAPNEEDRDAFYND